MFFLATQCHFVANHEVCCALSVSELLFAEQWGATQFVQAWNLVIGLKIKAVSVQANWENILISIVQNILILVIMYLQHE